jgi:hypothetical protein
MQQKGDLSNQVADEAQESAVEQTLACSIHPLES